MPCISFKGIIHIGKFIFCRNRNKFVAPLCWLQLIAVDRNNPEKVHDILVKQVHNKAKARDLCTSDIKRLPSEVVDCPLLLAATLDDPTIIKYMVEKHEVRKRF